MLAYILALAVGIGSIAIYLMAFLFPKIHRKNDFIWSGVGLFYALVLWIFARKISGGLLLGHIASVSLLGWFGWQTMTLRQQVPIQAQASTAATETSNPPNLPQPLAQVTNAVSGLFSGAKSRFQKPQPQDSKRSETNPASTAVERLRTVKDESVAETPTEIANNAQATPVAAVEIQTTPASDVSDSTTVESPEVTSTPESITETDNVSNETAESTSKPDAAASPENQDFSSSDDDSPSTPPTTT